jgi:hypothetical protein
MRSHRLWVRVLRAVAAAVAIVVLGLAAFVIAQQRVLRWRAERLLADIRAIQMGKSTLADAQRLMYKWGAWGEWQGDCAKDWCVFRVWMGDVSHALYRFPVLDGGNWGSPLRWPRGVNRPYRWAGGRFEEVEAEFEVRHGVIWSKSFAVLIIPLPDEYLGNGDLIPATSRSVIAQARSSTQCFHRGYLSQMSYFSADSPETCLFTDKNWIVAQYTPFADEDTVHQLMDFDLECLSSWRACSGQELMPRAASLIENFRQQTQKPGAQTEMLPIWILARDSEYVGIGEPSAVQSIPTDRQARKRQLRIVRLLKGDHLVSGAGVYMVNTVGSEDICSVPPSDGTALNGGREFILFFNAPLNVDPAHESEFNSCVAVPMIDRNLVDAQRGVARDTLLRDSAVY